MREQRIVRRSGLQEEAPPEIAAPGRGVEVWIEALEQARPQARLRLPQTEQPQRRLLEQVESEEQLVGALFREHDLDVVLTREAREQVHRRRGGAHEGRFRVSTTSRSC